MNDTQTESEKIKQWFASIKEQYENAKHIKQSSSSEDQETGTTEMDANHPNQSKEDEQLTRLTYNIDEIPKDNILERVRHYQRSIERNKDDENRLLHCIKKLYFYPITYKHLQMTQIGNTINSMRKFGGTFDLNVTSLAQKWTKLISAEANVPNSSIEYQCENQVPDTTHESAKNGKEQQADRKQQDRNIKRKREDSINEKLLLYSSVKKNKVEVKKDTDSLWQMHVEKQYRLQSRQEMETWREMFFRCQKEEKHKLSKHTEISNQKQLNELPARKTQLLSDIPILKPPGRIHQNKQHAGANPRLVATPSAPTTAQVVDISKDTTQEKKASSAPLPAIETTKDDLDYSKFKQPGIKRQRIQHAGAKPKMVATPASPVARVSKDTTKPGNTNLPAIETIEDDFDYSKLKQPGMKRQRIQHAGAKPKMVATPASPIARVSKDTTKPGNTNLPAIETIEDDFDYSKLKQPGMKRQRIQHAGAKLKTGDANLPKNETAIDDLDYSKLKQPGLKRQRIQHAAAKPKLFATQSAPNARLGASIGTAADPVAGVSKGTTEESKPGGTNLPIIETTIDDLDYSKLKRPGIKRQRIQHAAAKPKQIATPAPPIVTRYGPIETAAAPVAEAPKDATKELKSGDVRLRVMESLKKPKEGLAAKAASKKAPLMAKTMRCINLLRR